MRGLIEELIEAGSDIKIRVTHPKGGFFVRAYSGGKKVGQVAVNETLRAMQVDRSIVLPEFRGQGLGRRLYRRAAEVACAKYDKPLGSNDYQSSPGAKGLWNSEVRAGHVERVEGGFRYKCPVRFD